MGRFSKGIIISLGFVVILAGGATFFWQQNKKIETVLPTQVEQEETTATTETQNSSPSTEEVFPAETPLEVPPSSPSKKVTPDDCEQGCESFSTLPADQAYCFSFCGLNQGGYQGKNCMTLSGIDKDACFKEQAIRERNPETCARIGENSLRKACEARIAEELFD